MNGESRPVLGVKGIQKLSSSQSLLREFSEPPIDPCEPAATPSGITFSLPQKSWGPDFLGLGAKLVGSHGSFVIRGARFGALELVVHQIGSLIGVPRTEFLDCCTKFFPILGGFLGKES